MRRVILALCLAGATLCAAAEPLRVVSSIKPLQLLVTAIGGDEVDSRVLLPPGFSPHDAQLKPSQWKLLADAELLVWVGPALEQFLDKAFGSRPNALALLPLVGGAGDDPHIWLSLANVSVIAERLSAELSQRRPLKKALFTSNAARLVSALRRQDAALKQAFRASLPSYLLPHDGYRHFEGQYGLAPAAVISPGDDQMPGTAHIVSLRSRLLAGEFDCVFSESQHESRLQRRLLDGVDVRVIPLDSMGLAVNNDREGFVEYYRSLGEAFLACQ